MKDEVKAYNYLMQAIVRGVTFFEEIIAYFKIHFKKLAPEFIKQKNLKVEMNADTEKDILNMHEAFIGELKVSFSAALGKDRLYHRPCGFLNDQ